MKITIIISILLCFMSQQTYGQESFKRKYWLPVNVSYRCDDVVYLEKKEIKKFEDLSPEEQQKFRDRYPLDSTILIKKEEIVDGEKTSLEYKVLINEDFYKKLSKEVSQKVGSNAPNKGFVKFENDKVIVNPYLKKNNEGVIKHDDIYHYKLKNRQTLKLNFTEWTVSALTIPFKYRFKSDDIQEEFSTEVNLNAFIGFSVGSSSFFPPKGCWK